MPGCERMKEEKGKASNRGNVICGVSFEHVAVYCGSLLLPTWS